MQQACHEPNCKPVNTLMTHIPFTTLPKLTLPSPGCEVQDFTHTHVWEVSKRSLQALWCLCIQKTQHNKYH